LFSLLKPYLRVLRGVSKVDLPGYVGFSIAAYLSAAECLRTSGADLTGRMLSVDDPVAEGLVTSLAHPGGNIMGVDNSVTPELSKKLLEFLTKVVPAVGRIAALVDPRYAGTRSMVAETTRMAQALGVLPHVLDLMHNPEPHDSAQLTHAKYRRVDCGEYRIIHYVDSTVLHIPLIGKRSDDDVYKRLRRLSR
jgi:hypothetical protein